MRLFFMSKLVVIFSILAFSGKLFSADIEMAPQNDSVDTSKTLTISGIIRKGDTDKLMEIILDPNPDLDRYPISTVLLGPSKGGNIEEALSIGFLVRELKWKVIILDHCYSACSIIALSSPYRVFAGEIGLHRPYFNPDFYGDKESFYIEKWHKDTESKVRSHMKESHVSSSVIDKMMSVSSREMWMIPALSAPNVLSNFHPYFEEILLARCDGPPVTIPEFGMNANCVERQLKKMQKKALVNFLKAVRSGKI